MPDEAVRLEVCERLGIPVCPEGRCKLRFRSGRYCQERRRGGLHVHSWRGTIGARTRYRHNPIVEECLSFMTSAGRFVALEQRDPSMGPHAPLDIVEYASAKGGPAAYDVSVVTALRKSKAFVAHCAERPGYAAAQAHAAKLDTQYVGRLPGARLVPLIVETGGRWHPSVPPLLRRWARAYVARTVGLGDDATGLVVARWGARLSAALLRGNAAVHRRAGYAPVATLHSQATHGGPLAHLLPEGESAYELYVGS